MLEVCHSPDCSTEFACLRPRSIQLCYAYHKQSPINARSQSHSFSLAHAKAGSSYTSVKASAPEPSRMYRAQQHTRAPMQFSGTFSGSVPQSRPRRKARVNCYHNQIQQENSHRQLELRNARQQQGHQLTACATGSPFPPPVSTKTKKNKAT